MRDPRCPPARRRGARVSRRPPGRGAPETLRIDGPRLRIVCASHGGWHVRCGSRDPDGRRGTASGRLPHHGSVLGPAVRHRPCRARGRTAPAVEPRGRRGAQGDVPPHGVGCPARRGGAAVRASCRRSLVPGEIHREPRPARHVAATAFGVRGARTAPLVLLAAPAGRPLPGGASRRTARGDRRGLTAVRRAGREHRRPTRLPHAGGGLVDRPGVPSSPARLPSVRRSVGPSVRRSVGPSVRRSAGKPVPLSVVRILRAAGRAGQPSAAASARPWRMRWRPRRAWLLTVPRGMPVRSAICVWVRSAK